MFIHIKSKFLALVIEVYVKTVSFKGGDGKETSQSSATGDSHVRVLKKVPLIEEFVIKETEIKRII